MKVDREKQENLYEASSLSRKSTLFPEPALESIVARYSTQALVQQENEIKTRNARTHFMPAIDSKFAVPVSHL